jgi:hypothetical protein
MQASQQRYIVDKFHVTRLGLFTGTRDEALALSQLDDDQHALDYIEGYRGVPTQRMQMDFFVRFLDSDRQWLRYSRDLSSTVQFETYVRSRPELRMLLYTATVAKTLISEINSKPLNVTPNSSFYLNLRFYGAPFYDAIQDHIEDAYLVDYVYEANYGTFRDASHLSIYVYVPLRKQRLIFTGYYVEAFGRLTTLPQATVLVDQAFSSRHPCVLNNVSRASSSASSRTQHAERGAV